jgi:hypothetical protein
MALTSVMSFRMHATMTTLAGLPLARSRPAKSLMTGLQRMAASVAM